MIAISQNMFLNSIFVFLLLLKRLLYHHYILNCHKRLTKISPIKRFSMPFSLIFFSNWSGFILLMIHKVHYGIDKEGLHWNRICDEEILFLSITIESWFSFCRNIWSLFFFVFYAVNSSIFWFHPSIEYQSNLTTTPNDYFHIIINTWKIQNRKSTK